MDIPNGNGHGNGRAVGPKVDYDALIKRDAVHGRLFYDQAIFEDEMERLFGRTWIYVGHETEIPEPGDFVSRRIGLQPVVMVRGKDKQVRLFFNRCRHRANTVCLAEQGRSPGGFRCIYHGWTYATTGELVGVPYPEGFDPRDFNKADYGLAEIALESYRGFCFGNLNPREDLKSFMGISARRVLDQALDLSPQGEIEVLRTPLKGKFRGNWKLAMDNSADGYHAMFLHVSSFPIGRVEIDLDTMFGTGGTIRTRDLGHGHTLFDLTGANRQTRGMFGQNANKATPTPDQRAYIEAMTGRLGPERAQEVIANGDPGVLTLFPTVIYAASEIRVLQPVSLFETEVYYYPVLFKGAPHSLNAERLRQESFIHGPCGVVSADDSYVFERAQDALNARQHEWVIMKRGLRTEVREEDDVVCEPNDETGNRALWAQYHKVMTAAA